jgi:hypothetical protein
MAKNHLMLLSLYIIYHHHHQQLELPDLAAEQLLPCQCIGEALLTFYHIANHTCRTTVFQLGRAVCRVGSTISTDFGLCGHDVLSCPIYTRKEGVRGGGGKYKEKRQGNKNRK